MDYIIGPEEFAEKLVKHYGSIPALIETTYLCSISLYEFRIDKDVLCIEDYDIIKLKNDWPMKKGQEINVKKIRKGEESPIGEIQKGNEALDFREMILNKDTLENPKVIFQDSEGNYSVLVRAKSAFTFERNCAYALHLLNGVKLNFDGRRLMYTGAIQPSDYKEVRNALGLEVAKKIIWVCIWSQDKRFSAFVFNASESVFSPLMELAKLDEKYNIYVWNKVFPEEITDLDRAKYFTVLAEVAK